MKKHGSGASKDIRIVLESKGLNGAFWCTPQVVQLRGKRNQQNERGAWKGHNAASRVQDYGLPLGRVSHIDQGVEIAMRERKTNDQPQSF